MNINKKLHEKRILTTIKLVIDRISPNGEEYTPEEMAQAFDEYIIELGDSKNLNVGKSQ